MGDVGYRVYRAGDEVAINASFNRVFGLQRPLDEWRWKFAAEPEGRFIAVAVDEAGAVLAHYGAVPTRWRLGAMTARTGQIVDAFSVPEVRGRRVFSDLYEEFVSQLCNPQGLCVGFGFPGRRHYEMGLRQLRYVDLGTVPYFRREIRPEPLAAPHGLALRTGFDAGAVDDLWRRCRDRYPYAALRDAVRVGARFTGRPGVEYVHLSAWRDGECRAWAVARPLRGVLRCADLVWEGRDAGALASLDGGLQGAAARLGCGSCDAWLRSDPEADRELRRLGWVEAASPEDVVFVARTFHPEIDLEVLRPRLYLTLGDSDLV